MFCSKCGQPMSDEAVFCPNCGTARTGASVISSSVTSAPAQPSEENYALASSALKYAILSLVFSEFPVLGILGIIFAVIGKKKAAQAREANGGYFAKCRVAYILSRVGLGVSIGMTIFWVIYITILVAVVAGVPTYGVIY